MLTTLPWRAGTFLCSLLHAILLPIVALAGPYGLPDDPITLRSAHDKFVVAENDGAANANRDKALAWETFVVIDNRDGTISLLTDHNTYLVAEIDGGANANRNKIGAWEKFTVECLPNGRFAFRTFTTRIW